MLGFGPSDIMHWPFKTGESVSYKPPALLKGSPADFQSQTSWGLIFPVQCSRAGDVWCGSWTPHSSRRVSTPVMFLLLVGPTFRSGGPARSHLCPSYHSQCGFLFISFAVKECSISLQVILREGCSVCSCSLGVSVGGDEFRTLLLHRLDHPLTHCL